MHDLKKVTLHFLQGYLMSIKNTIARIIRSDFKQTQGNSSVQEIDTLLCHTLAKQSLKNDLPLETKPRLFNPKALGDQGVLEGKKSKPHSLMGPLQSLQQGRGCASVA